MGKNSTLNFIYRVAFRKKLYRRIDELQADLDLWLVEYNEVRTHQRRVLRQFQPTEPAGEAVEQIGRGQLLVIDSRNDECSASAGNGLLRRMMVEGLRCASAPVIDPTCPISSTAR